MSEPAQEKLKQSEEPTAQERNAAIFQTVQEMGLTHPVDQIQNQNFDPDTAGHVENPFLKRQIEQKDEEQRQTLKDRLQSLIHKFKKEPDPVEVIRTREAKILPNTPQANLEERTNQAIIREIRDGNGSLEQRQSLWNRLPDNVRRETPMPTDGSKIAVESKNNESRSVKVTIVDENKEDNYNDPKIWDKYKDKNVNEDWSDENVWSKYADIRDDEPKDRRHEALEKNKIKADLLKIKSENVTLQDLESLLQKYGTEQKTTDDDLEVASQKLRELLEKHSQDAISTDEAERMILIQHSKLKELTNTVTEYMYTNKGVSPKSTWDDYYSDQVAQISESLDKISKNITLDGSNSAQDIDFINNYISQEKKLIALRANFVKNGFSGASFQENEARIESEIAKLWQDHEHKSDPQISRREEEQDVMRNAQVPDPNAREGQEPPQVIPFPQDKAA